MNGALSIIVYENKNMTLCLSVFFLFSLCLILAAQHPLAGLQKDSLKELESKKIRDFNFVAAGDFGCSGKANKTITVMKSTNPEIVLALGDLSYQKYPDCWFNAISPLDNGGKFKIMFGEHDIDDDLVKYNQYLKHFNLTKPFYSFDYQNVHFLVMATSKNQVVSYLTDSEQYKFVKQDLSKAHGNKSIDWIIVSSFRPLYSSNTTHPGLDKLQDTYHKLFEKYDVDLVLQAHNHNYQRTYPLLYNEVRQSIPIITDNSTWSYGSDVKGQIFLTVGTGGQELYNFIGQGPYVVTQFLLHGFLNVEVTDNGSKLSGTFYDNRKLKDRDHFTIQRK